MEPRRIPQGRCTKQQTRLGMKIALPYSPQPQASYYKSSKLKPKVQPPYQTIPKLAKPSPRILTLKRRMSEDGDPSFLHLGQQALAQQIVFSGELQPPQQLRRNCCLPVRKMESCTICNSPKPHKVRL